MKQKGPSQAKVPMSLLFHHTFTCSYATKYQTLPYNVLIGWWSERWCDYFILFLLARTSCRGKSLTVPARNTRLIHKKSHGVITLVLLDLSTQFKNWCVVWSLHFHVQSARGTCYVILNWLFHLDAPARPLVRRGIIFFSSPRNQWLWHNFRILKVCVKYPAGTCSTMPRWNPLTRPNWPLNASVERWRYEPESQHKHCHLIPRVLSNFIHFIS